MMTIYYRGIGSMLVVTAFGKLASLVAADPVLGTLDLVTGLTFRNLFALAAGLEGAVALVLFRSRNLRALAYLSATTGAIFLSYRLASLLGGGGTRCPCLGALTGVLPVSERLASNFLLGVIALMLLPSIVGVVRDRGSERAA
ncbi:MAG: hypothetical protein KF833_08065 [Verrucomicrobiae bacterium]|nr:hypothetical protein [Verrucomicrobiae bacterium]